MKHKQLHVVEMTLGDRLREVVCVIFGHSWTSYGSTKDFNGRILEEYSECGYCGLENHDRSGHLALYKETRPAS